MTNHDIVKYSDEMIRISKLAASEILKVYMDPLNFGVETKEDGSPLTIADQISHTIITTNLRKSFPEIPIVSEEDNSGWGSGGSKLYWLIDPLDGTKEFVKRNGEFTINIALISEGYPLLGVVTVPVSNMIYIGGKDIGSQKIVNSKVENIKVKKISSFLPLKLIASRSHLNDATRDFITKLNIKEIVEYGSSLKFCKIAEGEVDIYPRLAPTCEWDTAAAQAVLEGAGGIVVDLHGRRLKYGKEEILNPFFIATSLSLESLGEITRVNYQ